MVLVLVRSNQHRQRIEVVGLVGCRSVEHCKAIDHLGHVFQINVVADLARRQDGNKPRIVLWHVFRQYSDTHNSSFHRLLL
jgi:hypothetical protein